MRRDNNNSGSLHCRFLILFGKFEIMEINFFFHRAGKKHNKYISKEIKWINDLILRVPETLTVFTKNEKKRKKAIELN